MSVMRLDDVDWRSMPCYEDPRKPGTNGYVLLGHNGRVVYAHRHTWEECYGDTLTRHDVIAHHCDNRRCRQPLHLFKTNIAGNNADMYMKGRGGGQWKRKTHCKRGHILAESAGVGRSHGTTYQRCYLCQQEWKRNKRKKIQQSQSVGA